MSKVKKVVEEVKTDHIPELDLVDKNITNILEIPGLCKLNVSVDLRERILSTNVVTKIMKCF